MNPATEITEIALDYSEKKQVEFDFTNEIAADSAATLSAVAVTVTAVAAKDSSPGDLVVGTPTRVGKKAYVMLQGRGKTVVYHVRCVGTDSDGLIHTLAANIVVSKF